MKLRPTLSAICVLTLAALLLCSCSDIYEAPSEGIQICLDEISEICGEALPETAEEDGVPEADTVVDNVPDGDDITAAEDPDDPSPENTETDDVTAAPDIGDQSPIDLLVSKLQLWHLWKGDEAYYNKIYEALSLTSAENGYDGDPTAVEYALGLCSDFLSQSEYSSEINDRIERVVSDIWKYFKKGYAFYEIMAYKDRGCDDYKIAARVTPDNIGRIQLPDNAKALLNAIWSAGGVTPENIDSLPLTEEQKEKFTASWKQQGLIPED